MLYEDLQIEGRLRSRSTIQKLKVVCRGIMHQGGQAEGSSSPAISKPSQRCAGRASGVVQSKMAMIQHEAGMVTVLYRDRHHSESSTKSKPRGMKMTLLPLSKPSGV